MNRSEQPIEMPCGVALPNRVALAPMTNIQSLPDGTLGDDELRWLVRRAEGGFGLISTCAAYVSDEGKAWSGQLGIASDDHVPGLTRLAEALAPTSACSIVQLHHAGAKATLAPDMRLSTVDGDGVRGATPEDLTRVVDDFVQAALRAAEAGFDGVEVHGANGYLFTQFLSPADNPRTDAYGEALQGRARLIRRAVKAVRESVPDDFVVGVRISPVDTFTRRGLRLNDSVHVARWLAADGADFIHLSLRQAWAPPPFEPTDVPVASAIRDAADGVPIVAAGGVWNRTDLERAFDAGVDVAAVGRAAIGNPDWPARVNDERFTPVRPPWSVAHLESVAVGRSFRRYLSGMVGLVEGGRTAH